MGTRSNIVKVLNDGSVNVIYCHWDGYVAGVGQALLDNYNTDSKVSDLIALGDMSSISPEIAYDRDRGESNCAASKYDSLHEYLDTLVDDIMIEYVYVFENNEWSVYSDDLVVSPVRLTSTETYRTTA
jgi:hypothetical protein